jgi:hypothetical protein
MLSCLNECTYLPHALIINHFCLAVWKNAPTLPAFVTMQERLRQTLAVSILFPLSAGLCVSSMDGNHHVLSLLAQAQLTGTNEEVKKISVVQREALEAADNESAVDWTSWSSVIETLRDVTLSRELIIFRSFPHLKLPDALGCLRLILMMEKVNEVFVSSSDTKHDDIVAKVINIEAFATTIASPNLRSSCLSLVMTKYLNSMCSQLVNELDLKESGSEGFWRGVRGTLQLLCDSIVDMKGEAEEEEDDLWPRRDCKTMQEVRHSQILDIEAVKVYICMYIYYFSLIVCGIGPHTSLGVHASHGCGFITNL